MNRLSWSRRGMLQAGAASAASVLAPCLLAAYPERSVTIIIPFPAGAAADASMRVVGKRLSDIWKRPVAIENKPGVPGVIAAASAPADGYSLLMGAGSTIVTAPMVNAKLAYRPEKSFTPVGRILTNTPILVSGPKTPIHSVGELIAAARKSPGKLTFSSSGIGSPNHLAMEMFQARTNTELLHVPYKGGATSVNELLGGFIDIAINAVPSVIQHVKSGRLKALAVVGESRDRNLPDVPTMREAGVPGFEYEIWYGLFAPIKTPAEIVDAISRDLVQALRDHEVVRTLDVQGALARPATSVEFARYIQQDIERWSHIIKDRNIKAE